MLKDENENEVTDSTGIENIIFHYFQSIYTSNNSNTLCYRKLSLIICY